MQYIITYGNPNDGFFHVGPFNTIEEAKDYASTEIDRDWWISEVFFPASEKKQDYMLDALLAALPFVEDAADDETYKAHRVHKVLKEIRKAIEKATGESCTS